MEIDSTVRVRGFHEGELAVQERAGVALEAARLTGMLAPADLRGGLGRFLAGRSYAAMAARDRPAAGSGSLRSWEIRAS